MVAGLASKFGCAVPFHMWVPDVYQGTNGGHADDWRCARAGRFAMISVRLLVEARCRWRSTGSKCSVLAIGSLLINLAAIARTNLKRIAGPIRPSQMGFVLGSDGRRGQRRWRRSLANAYSA